VGGVYQAAPRKKSRPPATGGYRSILLASYFQAPADPQKDVYPTLAFACSGNLVEIKGGALAGLRGRIFDPASRKRFVVEVDFIQRGASVLVDDVTLAPVIE
jgi:hypothetical protein